MPSLFGKSGSTAGRAKPRNKSIRGTISAPIPIPKTPDDDEFPIRNPGSAKALMKSDDEFPIRTPGTGIATPLPLTDSPGPSPDVSSVQPGERGLGEQQDQQPEDGGSSPGSSTEREQEAGDSLDPTPSNALASVGGSGGSRTDLAREIRPDPPSTPPPAPPVGSSTSVIRPASRPASRAASRPTSRSPASRSSPRKGSPLAVSPTRVSPTRASPPVRRATNPVLSTVRYSMLSDAPSKQTAQSKDAPQRKKSTLRSALGKLFGRGKKKNSNGSQGTGSGRDSGRDSGALTSAAQHRSDPTALGRPVQRSPKRSASLPMSEFDRPLRSHSIGPDDIMAIESARNSLQADITTPGSTAAAGSRKRAATTGGHQLLRPHLFNREWGAGLSPRPASTQGRAASRANGRAEPEDPSEIGRAITSDSGGGLRRRSRSLSGLQDFTGVPQLGRRRSDEIRYWRESYDPGFMSPLSSNAQDDVDDTAMGDVSAPDSPAAEKPPKTPPQPFNFGLLSREMVGMKITHAANMDVRLGDLESRTLQLERTVNQLCHAAAGTLLPQLPSFDPNAPPLPLPRNEPPSTSPSTVRGVASLPALGREQQPGPHHDEKELVTLLRADLSAERAARLALEAQVKKLAERVNTLSSTMFAMVRGPSEARSHERLGGPSVAPSSAVVGGSPKLPSKVSTSTLLAPSPAVKPLVPREQLSVFESDDEEEEEEVEQTPGLTAKKRVPELEEGDVTEDDFQTPREERTPGLTYGAFGEELRPEDDDDDDDGVEGGGGGGDGGDEDDTKRKKAARTLSLSQLTLGKGQRTRI